MRHGLALLLFIVFSLLFCPGAWAFDSPLGSVPTAPLTPNHSMEPTQPVRRDDEEDSPIQPTLGRIVLVTLKGRHGRLTVRPAIITEVFTRNMINVQVFNDGRNDHESFNGGGTNWETSIHYSTHEQPNTWRWMDIQASGGGFDARIKALEERIEALNAKQPKTQQLLPENTLSA